MDKEMQDKIKKQLDYKELNRLFCNHNEDKVCDDCRKRVTGKISPELTGNITGVEGKIKDIIQILNN